MASVTTNLPAAPRTRGRNVLVATGFAVAGTIMYFAGLLGVMLGQARQDDRRHGDGEDAQRKLDQPIGVIEPGDAAGDKKRRDQGVDEQIDLSDGRAERRRQT